jgi:enoyl-CoA hydratase
LTQSKNSAASETHKVNRISYFFTNFVESTKENALPAFWFFQKKFSDVFQLMRAIPQPIIAAVNGPAAGGGFSLAMASDIRICEPKSKFIAAYINIGLSACDLGCSYFLPRLVGMSLSSDIMLTGRQVLADEADKIGLVTKVVEFDQLLPAAMEYANIMLGKSYFGLSLTKELINAGTDADSLGEQILKENRNQTLCSAFSNDMDQVIKAF